MKRVPAIKTYFERTDKQAPNGGKKVSMTELKALMADSKAATELGKLACEELGEPYEE